MARSGPIMLYVTRHRSHDDRKFDRKCRRVLHLNSVSSHLVREICAIELIEATCSQCKRRAGSRAAASLCFSPRVCRYPPSSKMPSEAASHSTYCHDSFAGESRRARRRRGVVRARSCLPELRRRSRPGSHLRAGPAAAGKAPDSRKAQGQRGAGASWRHRARRVGICRRKQSRAREL